MFEKILMVCTGNLCRSPMAEAWMRHRLGDAARTVSSAGLAALAGEPAAPHAVSLLAARGVDLSAHRARRLGLEDLLAADLVLVMENWHKAELERLSPAARGRAHLLGRWRDDEEIPDPYGEGPEAYASVFGRIEPAVDAWLARF